MAYLPSSDELTQVITAIDVATTTALSSSMNPAPQGTDLTFTALITAADGSNPSGSVQFYVDGATLGAPVPLVPGELTVFDMPGTLSAGSHVVRAEYLP